MRDLLNAFLTQETFAIRLEGIVATLVVLGLLAWQEWPMRPHQKIILTILFCLQMTNIYLIGRV